MSAQPLAALNEPSLADAIAHIERSETLRVEQRSHWTCSMRFVARALDRPHPSFPPAGRRFAPGSTRSTPRNSM
ncbi:MAG: hypothetical protein WCF81_21880 [Roseiarcus sp.]